MPPQVDFSDFVGKPDFPITAYERPALALHNILMRGDVDGLTRSIFAPETLSPAQMRTFKDEILKGKARENPVLKTITDLATNPLVIIGLGLAIGYPTGSGRPLFDLRRGTTKLAERMSKNMSYISNAFTNLAHAGGSLHDDLIGVVREGHIFGDAYSEKLNNAWMAYRKTGGKLSKNEGRILGMYLQGWDKPNSVTARIYGLGSAPLAPNLKSVMSKDLRTLGNDMRTILDDVWDRWEKSPGGQAKYSAAVAKEMHLKGINLGSFQKGYFPRLLSFNKYQAEAYKSYGVRKGYSKLLKELIPTNITGHVKTRSGGSIPVMSELAWAEQNGYVRQGVTQGIRNTVEFNVNETIARISNDLRNVVQVVNPDEATGEVKKALEGVFKSHRKTIAQRLGGEGLQAHIAGKAADTLMAVRNDPKQLAAELDALARVLVEPPQYTLNAVEAMPRYLKGMSHTWGWHGTGLGTKIMQQVNHNPNLQTGWVPGFLNDELLPMMRGLKHWKSFQRNAEFVVMKDKFRRWFQSPVAESLVPQSQREWMLDYLSDARGSLSADSVGGAIGRFFYLNTLGLNIGATSKNSMQPFLTTMNLPGVGVAGLGRGVKRVGKSMPAFLRDIAEGKTAKEAMAQHFPEYLKAVGPGAPLLDEMTSGDLTTGQINMPQGVVTAWDKTKKAMMAPFSVSESWNRLVSFYSGYENFMFQNPANAAGKQFVGEALKDAAGKFGTDVMMLTQFPGGPLGMPRALMGMSMPMRQFAHFPLRFASSLAASTHYGANPSKMDLGTIGRTLAASTGIAVGAKNLLGADLSAGLAFGALPVPSFEGTPFYPFPVVPPAIGAAGSVAMAALGGSTEPLQKSWGMFVPGGIALRRALNTAGPKRAAYDQRDENGRIPVFNKEGSLIGQYSSWELSMKAIGIQPTSTVAEQNAVQWVLSQRDRIRDYRRQYMEAIYKNDHRKAMQINSNFKKVYPELGSLQIKKADITALQNRKQITRLNRVMKGLPAGYRPLFQSALDQASLSSITADRPDLQQILDIPLDNDMQ